MRYLLIFIWILFINGCAVTDVNYSLSEKKMDKHVNYYENEECTYLAGPFTVASKLDIDEAVKKTIKKANKDGYYGNKIANVKVKEGGYITPVFSRLCLYISGNIIYDENYFEE